MRDKIKQISKVGWLGIILVSVSIAILVPTIATYLFDVYTIEPWRNAYKVSTAVSINIFSDGTAGDSVYSGERLSALAGILILLITGPGLFILYGFEENEDSDKEKRYSSSFIKFVSGLTLFIASLFLIGVETAIYTYTHNNSKIRASQSAKTDEIRQNLSMLATESFEYLVLPEELGGGGGSFEDLNIEDLPSYGELESGSYMFGESNSDTLLRIIGTAKPDYPTDDSDREEVELIVNVQPSDIIRWEDSR